MLIDWEDGFYWPLSEEEKVGRPESVDLMTLVVAQLNFNLLLYINIIKFSTAGSVGQ